MAEYPQTVTDRVDALLKANLTDASNIVIGHYAGEFLSEETLRELVAQVSQYPTLLYDIELIQDLPEQGDSTQRMPRDEIIILVYACSSNRSSQAEQWINSYVLAHRARKAIVGQEFENVAATNSNSFFQSDSIERELHIPGLSVHTLRLLLKPVVQLDPETP